MSSQHSDRVDELFLAGSRIPPEERAAWLDEVCAGDAELRAEVASLLRHDSADGALRRAERAVESGLGELRSAAPLPDTPASIGSYRIVGVLGRGGMGTVYEAEQERPRRTVALKVLHAGLVTPGMLRRFEWEAEVLGWLEHPGIARIFEAGTAGTGDDALPFFAMELVRGSAITSHAAEAGLSTRARLELMVSVCEAVHHAHQKGVVHRDLKPANVLVDTAGRAKVLDFGVARVADSDLRATTLETRAGDIIGTLPYMSPEQVGGDPAAVDTRSDVYALGVLTYELLSGRLPIQVLDTPLPRAVNAIATEEPARLGTVDRSLRGDVETIVAKAIEKDKDRRYSSALELAEDLRRFLADEPIVARPPSALYQLGKLARRNRAAAAGLVTAFAALAVAAVVSTSLYLDADAARTTAEAASAAERAAKELAQANLARARAAEVAADKSAEEATLQAVRATAEATTSNEVRRFLTDLFLEGRQVKGRSGELSVRELVDRGAARVHSELGRAPAVQADLMGVLGLVYSSLGHYRDAEPLLERSVAITRELGREHEHFLVVALLRLAHLHRDLGDFERAAGLLEEAVATGEDAPGVRLAEWLTALRDSGQLLAKLGRHAEARAALERSIEVARASEEIPASFALPAKQGLAQIERQLGNLEGAVELLEETERELIELGGAESTDMARLTVAFADVLMGVGRIDDAEQRLLQAKAIVDREDIEYHPDFYLIDGQLARVAMNRGDFDTAGERLDEVLAFQRSEGLGRHQHTAVTLYELGRVRRRQGRLVEAASLLLEGIGITIERQGPGHASLSPPLRELEETLTALARQPWDGEGAAPWERALEETMSALEGSLPREAQAILDATLRAAEGR